MTKHDEPLIGPDGEVREITAEDIKGARRGRPPLPASKRRKRVNLMLAPDVAEALDREQNKSEAVNKALRAHLGL